MRTILISGASSGIGLNIAHKELIRKKSIYQFGLEKLMRFDEKLLREFFGSFFKLPKTQWLSLIHI